MLAKIPPNTYPLRPTAYASYWRLSGNGSQRSIVQSGLVPVWVAFHDGGPSNRILTVIVVRVRPTLEVVLVGGFGEELVWQKTEQAVRRRVTLAHWPERKFWVSHVVYLGQPPKRKTAESQRKRNRNWFERFCNGRLYLGPNRSRMLVFAPVIGKDTERKLDVWGRFDSPTKHNLDFNMESNQYFLVNQSEHKKQHEAIQAIDRLLNSGKKKSTEIVNELKHAISRSYIMGMLLKGVELGFWNRTGNGTKGDPHTYQKREDSSGQDSSTTHEEPELELSGKHTNRYQEGYTQDYG